MIISFINGSLKTCKIPFLIWVLILATNSLISVRAQTVAVDPVLSIRELKDGYLIVRMPYSKAKIDTLQSMVSRANDANSKVRLQKLLQETINERDTLLADYTKAFRDYYRFSKAAYFLDNEGRDLRKATFYNMDGTVLSKDEMGLKPVYYLYFERTRESHIDALAIYNIEGSIIPPPFPNNFTQGGINFLFLKISEKKFPAWRVERINKRLYKYWNEYRGSE